MFVLLAALYATPSVLFTTSLLSLLGEYTSILYCQWFTGLKKQAAAFVVMVAALYSFFEFHYYRRRDTQNACQPSVLETNAVFF